MEPTSGLGVGIGRDELSLGSALTSWVTATQLTHPSTPHLPHLRHPDHSACLPGLLTG